MKAYNTLKYVLALILLSIFPIQLLAFDSGSTGADGAFAPTVSQSVALPADGIFNYTTVNIPAGVIIKYTKNAVNSPAIILAQGDVVIDGTIDISGGDGGSSNDPAAVPGSPGGPGGFDGGKGGNKLADGGNGFGPGGGLGGKVNGSVECGGTGAGFAIAGGTTVFSCTTINLLGGKAYGSDRLLPMIGGAGGGGGVGSVFAAGSLQFTSGSGGGGGGAILIAVSGTLSVNGNILAAGGAGGDLVGSTNEGNTSGAGGAGSGGGVRLVATKIDGTGNIDVSGGASGTNAAGGANNAGGEGSFGRVRLEADTLMQAPTVTPAGAGTSAAPSSLFVSNLPTIRISTVDGVAVPTQPTGIDDVILPGAISNPVTVEFEASGIPLGTSLSLTVTPLIGDAVTSLSTTLTGTLESSTATASIDLPQGASVLSASVSFTVTASNDFLLDRFSRYAMNERIERVDVATKAGEGSITTFITETGKEYTWSSNAIAFTN
jgi:hypothetical protein